MTHFGAPFLFILTAIAEIVGCYLPLLWLRGQAKIWVLLPAAGALFAFVWLLTLHPNEAGRTYAAYGCVYVAVALGWLWVVEGIKPTRWDALGVGLAIAGMLVIVYAPRGTAP